MQPHQDTLAAPTTPEDQIPAIYLEDWRLVQRCRQGDRGAWAALVERHEAAIFFTIRHALLSRGADAPDALIADLQADVFLGLVQNDFRRLSRYAGRCRLSHWLKVVASNHTIDALRQRRPTVSLEDPSPRAQATRASLTDHAPSPEQALSQRQALEALRDLCAALPAEDRRFLELHLEQELSFEEIAAAMDTTVGAVYARKNRIRKKLMSMIEARDRA
jgi:RNA polymerase sigma-70 factor (ECF subfamily)